MRTFKIYLTIKADFLMYEDMLRILNKIQDELRLDGVEMTQKAILEDSEFGTEVISYNERETRLHDSIARLNMAAPNFISLEEFMKRWTDY